MEGFYQFQILSVGVGYVTFGDAGTDKGKRYLLLSRAWANVELLDPGF